MKIPLIKIEIEARINLYLVFWLLRTIKVKVVISWSARPTIALTASEHIGWQPKIILANEDFVIL